MESNWESRECFFPFFSFSLYLSLRFKIARAMDRNFEFARSFARTAANYNYSEFQCKKKKKKKKVAVKKDTRMKISFSLEAFFRIIIYPLVRK